MTVFCTMTKSEPLNQKGRSSFPICPEWVEMGVYAPTESNRLHTSSNTASAGGLWPVPLVSHNKCMQVALNSSKSLNIRGPLRCWNIVPLEDFVNPVQRDQLRGTPLEISLKPLHATGIFISWPLGMLLNGWSNTKGEGISLWLAQEEFENSERAFCLLSMTQHHCGSLYAAGLLYSLFLIFLKIWAQMQGS